MPPKVKGEFFQSTEWPQIILMLALATLTLFGIGVLFRHDRHLATTLLSCIGMHAAGARAPAVLFSLMRGLSPAFTLFFNFYIEVIIVILCYYSFVLVVREGIETKFMHLAAKQAEAAAQTHRNLLKRFELAGLFIFVMAPLPMTGPVTGALVGYLLNIKPWVNFAVILSGTFCALAAYVLLGHAALERIISLQREYEGIGTLLTAVIIAAFTIFHVRGIAKWVQDKSE